MLDMDTSITYNTLANGLRCVHCAAPGHAEYFGLIADTGSRDEAPGEEGLAHFVEHTIFKGTARRKSWHIINRMESVGGELNAYTTKESTAVYTVFPSGNLDRAMELIADLVTGSRFPQAEIDREREVVADEINSYLDMPSEAVFDEFDDLIFAGSPLGHNILGRVDTISGFTPEVCRRYLTERYVPGRMAAFYMGGETPERVAARMERYFGGMHHADSLPRRTVPAMLPPFDSRQGISSHHQAHTVMGMRVGSMYSPDRYAVALLTNMLGGPGMNSMLNVEMRERRGLVYTVEASTALYTDCGLLTVYFGCDPDDVERCRKITMRTLERLASAELPERTVRMARRQYAGQLTVAQESRENRALSMGRAMLYRGGVTPADEVRRAIEAVTPAQLRSQARQLLDSGVSVLTLG